MNVKLGLEVEYDIVVFTRKQNGEYGIELNEKLNIILRMGWEHSNSKSKAERKKTNIT